MIQYKSLSGLWAGTALALLLALPTLSGRHIGLFGGSAMAYYSEKAPRPLPDYATDSAAAATAMAAGEKTEAGNISWAAGDPPQGMLENLGDRFSSMGWAVGLVSTVPFSHATPACFAAHNTDRSHYYQGYGGRDDPGISEQMIFVPVADLIIGGGHPEWSNPQWSNAQGYISEEAYNRLIEGRTDMVFVQRTPGMDGALSLSFASALLDPDQGSRLMGLFGGPSGCFEPPLPTSDGSSIVSPATQENPTLAEASVVALEYLGRDDQGFFLMIEQGDIDWANHCNDFRWLLGSMWDMEQAVLAIVGYVDRSELLNWDNTLLVVTSDHCCGGFSIHSESSLAAGILPLQIDSLGGYHYPNREIDYRCDVHTNYPVSIAAKGPHRIIRLIEELAGSHPAPRQDMLDNTQIHDLLVQASESDPPVNHLILVIGDGMSPEVEKAASLYLYGRESALSWHNDSLFDYHGLCATWDIDTYNSIAETIGAPQFDSRSFDPQIGILTRF